MLKTIENKNTNEFENVLDELIKEYDSNEKTIKNIHKLPNGLKGIFYYKLYNNDNISLNINISSKIIDISKKINHKEYVLLCKISGIILDNAIEAAAVSKEKKIFVEIYNSNNEYIINVDNSTNGKVDIDKIKNKNYSTKGKNRGLGLYILDKVLKDSKIIKVEQSVNKNIFNTKIIIKIKRTY